MMHGNRWNRAILVAATSLLFLAALPALPASPDNLPAGGPAALRAALGRAWEDHSDYSHLMILGVFGEMQGTEVYGECLMNSAVRMSDALKPFYGDGALKFGALLEQHVKIGEDLVQSAKRGDQTFRDAWEDWYANADEIAALLSALNPKYWPYDKMRNLWRAHLDSTLDQVISIQAGDSKREVACYEAAKDNGGDMAEFLATGIASQFPPKSSGPVVKMLLDR